MNTTGEIIKGSSDKNIKKQDFHHLLKLKNVRVNNNVMIQKKKKQKNDSNCVEYNVIFCILLCSHFNG